ncbi:hypothetical protein [Pontibacter harenae]|uniref:hypothetical protein n=1 Tax=Pontibacter harenae TaxID=2894083 RepID=UPI001E5E6262|nr:hypothetical protein [Pontibacter harenae]MCC9166981.1 hypothetical protein [Pontibacter harenae]
MAGRSKKEVVKQQHILTPDQDELLDLYIKNLDNFFEEIKESEKVEVEIETLHLKRMLTK